MKNHKIYSNIWEEEVLLDRRYKSLRGSIKNIRRFAEVTTIQKSADC